MEAKYIERGNVVYLQVKPHKRVKTTRRAWKPLNQLQAWLEGEDKLSARVVGYGVVVVAGLFLVGQVVRCVFWN